MLDGLQQLHPEAGPIMQELVKRLAQPSTESFLPVLVFAEKVLLIGLINLALKRR